VRVDRHPNGVVTWSFDFAGPDLVAAVTTRAGGGSAGVYASCNLGGHVGDDPGHVAANRHLVAEALGVGRLTIADQQHGREVAIVDEGLAGAGHDPTVDLDPRLVGVDGLVTTVPGVGLAILVADCAPVVLVDPVRRAVAVVHVGRRGAVLDVVAAAVEALGSDPAELVAGIGPCIGAAAYEIDGVALDEAREAFGDELLEPTSAGRARFDLRTAVVCRLTGAGIAGDRIEVMPATTDSSPDDLFSDRAARPCGRFALVAALHPTRSGPDLSTQGSTIPGQNQ
jgi:YfiH family protein